MTANPESRPRILLISSLFAPEIGGVCKVAESLARELNKYVVVVAAKTPGLPEGVPSWESFDKQFTFPIYRLKSFKLVLPERIMPRLRGPLQFGLNLVWTRPRVLFALLRILTEHRIDVLCVNTLSDYWIPAALRRFNRNLKVIFYLHGEEVSLGIGTRRLQKFQFRALSNADALIAVSSFTRGLIQRANIRTNIVVINNGVDAVKFAPGPKDSQIISRFGLEGKRVLLCLGRLDVRKGQDMLLASMPQILEQVPDAVLMLVGSGDDLHRLLELRNSANLGDSVIFAGAATDDEVVSFYRTADVYALPNRQLASGDTEGFGLVFLEAGACGKPVIGGNAGGVPDAIVDGQTGFLIDGESSDQIIQACVRLLLDTETAGRLGSQGRKHALTKTWSRQTEQVLSLCRSLIEEERF